MEFDAPEEMGGGNFLNTPGTYLLHVDQVLEGQYSSGALADGFTVGLSCLDGTVRDGDKCTEVGKTCNITFYNGKLTHKDKGVFFRVRQAAFLVASNVIGPSDLGKKINIDLQKAVGHIVVMTLELGQDGKYLEVSGASVYHVDDPRISGVPKSPDHLKLIAPAFRHPKEWFDSLMKKKAKPASGSGSAGGNGTPVGAGSGATSEAVNFDNL